ncbi:MAG: T9SS type A sorting domain-containing protein, partial [Flavobacteriales bacterium]
DITTTGFAITDLADDNLHGPITMTANMPYYWYDVKKVWVASNGYVAFNGGNIAATFPPLPAAGGTDNYIAALMSDLTYTGAGNPGQCFVQDEATQFIVSWINVPFWSVTSPGYTGSNTFQLILNKVDSTITMQYQSTTGITGSNGPIIGIESITGTIGLARSQSMMPAAGYAVRFYNPALPLLQVKDASVDWVGEPGTGGITMAVGATLPLATRIQNTGNQALQPFTMVSKVISAGGQTIVTETLTVDALQPSGTVEPILSLPFVPNAPGTYKHQITLSGITGELVTANNVMEREVVVYSPTANINKVSWAGLTDDGLGLAWNGGDGGIGAYIMPPFYPCQITGTTVRISSNSGSNFCMKVYDDDGVDGGPGTLLDSVMVQAANGGVGDHVYPLNSAIQVTQGGYYVVWYMVGPNVNIAMDNVGPFSLRCYEVLGGAWSEYRDRVITDFHLGLQIQQAPFLDVGVAGLIGISNGQIISTSTIVKALVQNYGNTPASGFPVNYSFNGGPVVTQNYTGSNIAPGNSAIMTFTQPLLPVESASGNLCVWTSASTDNLGQNDTACVSIDVAAGINDLDRVELTVLPNPARDIVSVEGLPTGQLSFQVMDVQGRQVMVGERFSQAERWSLDISGLSDGAYVLRSMMGSTVFHGRFLVQH